VKDKLAAEPGGVGKPEASYHQQQATKAVHSTIIAQLQATGRNPASTTTRKKLIHGVQDLAIRGVWLYATDTTPLMQSYPWRTACTP
jgi:hypothetical protein